MTQQRGRTRSVRSLWITRKQDADWPPELLVAWDDYSIEVNYDGWEAACKDALASVGNEVRDWRVIDLTLPQDKINAAFDVPVVDGDVF